MKKGNLKRKRRKKIEFTKNVRRADIQMKDVICRLQNQNIREKKAAFDTNIIMQIR